MKVAFFNGGGEVANIVFNSEESTKVDWFNCSRILSSSWPRLNPIPTTTSTPMTTTAPMTTAIDYSDQSTQYSLPVTTVDDNSTALLNETWSKENTSSSNFTSTSYNDSFTSSYLTDGNYYSEEMTTMPSRLNHIPTTTNTPTTTTTPMTATTPMTTAIDYSDQTTQYSLPVTTVDDNNTASLNETWSNENTSSSNFTTTSYNDSFTSSYLTDGMESTSSPYQTTQIFEQYYCSINQDGYV